MLRVNKGSIEYLPVQVADKLGEVSTLDDYGIEFRITDVDEIEKVAWTSCINDGMTVLPLVDATGLDDGTNYKLWIKITFSPEVPILGPFEFGVS